MQRRTVVLKKHVQPRPRDNDSNMSSRRFPPQLPAIPGRKQDDGARQVSWLPALSLSSTFPRPKPQWHIGRALAGYSCGSRGFTPRSHSNPLREPCAYADHTRLVAQVNPPVRERSPQPEFARIRWWPAPWWARQLPNCSKSIFIFRRLSSWRSLDANSPTNRL